MTVTGLGPVDVVGSAKALDHGLGAAATAAVWSWDAMAAPQAVSIAGAVLVLRLRAMRNDWRAPTARQRPEH